MTEGSVTFILNLLPRMPKWQLYQISHIDIPASRIRKLTTSELLNALPMVHFALMFTYARWILWTSMAHSPSSKEVPVGEQQRERGNEYWGTGHNAFGSHAFCCCCGGRPGNSHPPSFRASPSHVLWVSSSFSAEVSRTQNLTRTLLIHFHVYFF